MKQVMCNVDLYGGDTKAGKWYDVVEDDGETFGYKDDKNEILYCLYDSCSHLPDGAYWSFREKPQEVSQSTLDKLIMLAADALRDDEYQIAIDIINLVKEHK